MGVADIILGTWFGPDKTVTDVTFSGNGHRR